MRRTMNACGYGLYMLWLPRVTSEVYRSGDDHSSHGETGKIAGYFLALWLLANTAVE